MARRDGLRRSVRVTQSGPRNRGYGRYVDGVYHYTCDFRGAAIRTDPSDERRRHVHRWHRPWGDHRDHDDVTPLGPFDD